MQESDGGAARPRVRCAQRISSCVGAVGWHKHHCVPDAEYFTQQPSSWRCSRTCSTCAVRLAAWGTPPLTAGSMSPQGFQEHGCLPVQHGVALVGHFSVGKSLHTATESVWMWVRKTQRDRVSECVCGCVRASARACVLVFVWLDMFIKVSVSA